jgi:starch phosphorylase
VALGALSADDVEVQVVHGRIGSDDVLTGTTVTPMSVGESYDGNRHRFDAAVPLATSGPFGYTVRVVPRNDALASVAELGLVAEPA